MIKLIDFLLQLYSFALIGYAILSWIKVDQQHPTVKFLKKIVVPVLDPVRKVIPPVGGFDLSVIAVLFLIQFVRYSLLS